MEACLALEDASGKRNIIRKHKHTLIMFFPLQAAVPLVNTTERCNNTALNHMHMYTQCSFLEENNLACHTACDLQPLPSGK